MINKNENESGLLNRDEEVVGKEVEVETNEDEKGESEDSKESPRFNEIERKLSDLGEGNKATTELAKILGDSDVRTLLDAKARGDKISLKVGEDEDESVETPDLESLSQTELVQHLLGQVEKAFGKNISAALEPLVQRINGVEGFVDDQGKDKLSQGIESARKKFSDFDEYQDEMIGAYEHPESLSPEELYVIAKLRKGGFATLGKDTSSEKPSGAGVRPALTKQRKTPIGTGVQAFRRLLSESTDRQVETNWGREE